ncbi:hypothetical protein TRFO_38571 [Tritrichomonas foetus]|uniref:Uncharacterized protein n=1 Tax=Tritrichomonas foetus TaxID=1144522 RepID=A0A1J4J859_9EUKA|nr:hypothetical protein TRFO_38571 [Tritrichomonas foetus]|eukprot:OHS95320.1 hypothetical protein TRFO_38571 [Tritrichomonas foetus]
MLLENSKINKTPKTADGKLPIHYACQSGDLNMVKFLVNSSNINEGFDKQNLTPLHIASKYGHEKIVLFLLKQKDIKINATASITEGVFTTIYKIQFKNLTPLHMACQSGNVNVVNLLISKPTISINAVSVFSYF